jgi:hypothetical protein
MRSRSVVSNARVWICRSASWLSLAASTCLRESVWQAVSAKTEMNPKAQRIRGLARIPHSSWASKNTDLESLSKNSAYI